jgi:hypothetical protein
MFQWFWRLLYESKPAEFRSAFGLEESVERLRAATKRSVFSSLSEAAAVGKVSEQRVRLQRVIPMVGDSFKPFFIGRFEIREGVTVLTGRFSLLMIVKVFMTFWLGMAFVFAGGMLLGHFSSPKPVPAFLAFQPFLMLGFGIALVAMGKWFARNDVAWLSSVIEGALRESKKSASVMMLPASADPDAAPTLGVVGGISGPRDFLAKLSDCCASASRDRSVDRLSNYCWCHCIRHHRCLGVVVVCAAEAFLVGVTGTTLEVEGRAAGDEPC